MDFAFVSPRGARYDDNTHNLTALNSLLKSGLLKAFMEEEDRKRQGRPGSKLFNALKATLIKSTKLHAMIQAMAIVDLRVIRPLDQARVSTNLVRWACNGSVVAPGTCV